MKFAQFFGWEYWHPHNFSMIIPPSQSNGSNEKIISLEWRQITILTFLLTLEKKPMAYLRTDERLEPGKPFPYVCTRYTGWGRVGKPGEWRECWWPVCLSLMAGMLWWEANRLSNCHHATTASFAKWTRSRRLLCRSSRRAEGVPREAWTIRWPPSRVWWQGKVWIKEERVSSSGFDPCR